MLDVSFKSHEKYPYERILKMHVIMDYLPWCLLRLLNIAAACFLFMLDRKSVQRMRANNRHAVWYRRGFFLGAWFFLLPLIGIDGPQMMISLLLFHGTVLPFNLDFDYQLSLHSLSIFTWLAIFTYGVNIMLISYCMYLGVSNLLSQRKEETNRRYQ